MVVAVPCIWCGRFKCCVHNFKLVTLGSLRYPYIGCGVGVSMSSAERAQYCLSVWVNDFILRNDKICRDNFDFVVPLLDHIGVHTCIIQPELTTCTG